VKCIQGKIAGEAEVVSPILEDYSVGTIVGSYHNELAIDITVVDGIQVIRGPAALGFNTDVKGGSINGNGARGDCGNSNRRASWRVTSINVQGQVAGLVEVDRMIVIVPAGGKTVVNDVRAGGLTSSFPPAHSIDARSQYVPDLVKVLLVQFRTVHSIPPVGIL